MKSHGGTVNLEWNRFEDLNIRPAGGRESRFIIFKPLRYYLRYGRYGTARTARTTRKIADLPPSSTFFCTTTVIQCRLSTVVVVTSLHTTTEVNSRRYTTIACH